MATVQEFEEQVWSIEGIRLVIRAPEGTQISDYDYKNAAQSNINVTKWISTRITPSLNGFEATVIQGNGEEPHGRNLLKKVRETYGD